MRIHSLLCNNCRVTVSPIHGRGIFAIAPIAAGELVAIWGGKVFTAEEVARLSSAIPHFSSHSLCIGAGYYLGSDNMFELDDAELFNHCCEPNVGIRGQILLVARRSIDAGEELTFDYDTTETSSGSHNIGFNCHCGSKGCRGTIDGSSWTNPEFIKRNREYLSSYILELLKKG